MKYLYLTILFSFLFACGSDDDKNNNEQKEEQKNETKVFTEMPTKQTNLHFSNRITESDNINYFGYTYLYNGGGVSIVDINNDGLPDIILRLLKSLINYFLIRGNLNLKTSVKLLE